MKFLRLLLVPFALLAVAAMRLLYPLVKIRLGVLMSNRIGHLAGNTEIYLAEQQHGKHAGFLDLWTHHHAICNRQLARMVNRVMHVDRTRFLLLVILCNKLFQGWDRHDIGAGNWDRDVDNLLEKYPPRIHLTDAERRRGFDTLREWGLPPDAKWVCLIVRDDAYLPNLAYHSYRNSDVQTYLQACEELTERGYYVFRMGAKVEKPINTSNPRIIDYATNGTRSDFMDMYLGTNCEFCISTGCGFDAIPYLARRPICYVNYVPLEYLFTFAPRSLAIWKHHEKDGKRMTPFEIYHSGAGHFMSTKQFADAGITLVDNTPQEIADVVREMASVVEGCATTSMPAEETQAAFWAGFPRSESTFTGKPLHGEIRMRIGSKFLSDYGL